MELLERSGVQISGKRAVVIGRSNIVGTPAALLLQQRDATVTVVHSRTRDAQAIVSEADIVIAAMGKPEFVRGSWIKPGAAVIDVGTNPVPVRAQPCLLRMPTFLQGTDMKIWLCRTLQRSEATGWWATLPFTRQLRMQHILPLYLAASAR